MKMRDVQRYLRRPKLVVIERGRDPRVAYVKCPRCRHTTQAIDGVITTHGTLGFSCPAAGTAVELIEREGT